jgi:hypothetical protein
MYVARTGENRSLGYIRPWWENLNEIDDMLGLGVNDRIKEKG